MPREPILQDKIHLLMEETGCDQGQAELAMTSAGYDLEKAIRTIATLLRNIVVVKGKFQLPAKNQYGLLILIADTKRQNLFRLRAVVSYNPSLFETSLDGDWYEFERSLYAFRLWEGTLQQVTQDLERVFLERLERMEGQNFYEVLREGQLEPLQERFGKILSGHFAGGTPELVLSREELNLEQYRRLRKEVEASPAAGHERPLEPSGGESLSLNVDLQQDADGVPAREVRAGDGVYVLLTDGRDIARYLSKLLGGLSDKGLTPLIGPVEEVRRDKDTLIFQIRLSTGILGLAEIQESSLLKVQRRVSPGWWRRWIPFLSQ